jgi:hypothetical protein
MPPREATPTIVINLQIELLGKAVGIDHEEQAPSGRYVSNRAKYVGAPLMQNDSRNLRSSVPRNEPSFGHTKRGRQDNVVGVLRRRVAHNASHKSRSHPPAI